MYEGDLVNDKREGYGKFINEDGKYYIRAMEKWFISWKRNILLFKWKNKV